MRELNTMLGSEPLTLAATFKASLEINERIADPLMIAREAAIEAMMTSSRMPYTPRWSFTVENVPMIIWIGLKHAGDKRTLSDVQDMVFDAGFIAGRDVAVEYLAKIVTPQSEEVVGGDAEPGE